MKVLATIALVTLVSSTSPAASATNYRIDIRGIDLDTAEGVSKFDTRVRRAGRRACSGYQGLRRLSCAAAFRAEAINQLPTIMRQTYVATRTSAARQSEFASARVTAED